MSSALGRRAVAILTAIAAAACAASSNDVAADAGAQDGASETVVASCPSDDVPTGTCPANARCSHSASCTPGVRMVCNTRWTCACVDGQWACSIAPGSGLGCTPCPGYEQPDADGGDAGDATTDVGDGGAD